MASLTEELRMLVQEEVKEHGCRLYHLEMKGQRLEVYVDKDGGATLGDCEQISRTLALTLMSVRDEWRNLILDISTPGIERQLYTPEHYQKALGERLLIKIKGQIIEGRLLEADEEGIVLDIETGVDRRLKYNEILTAQVRRTTEELFKRR